MELRLTTYQIIRFNLSSREDLQILQDEIGKSPQLTFPIKDWMRSGALPDPSKDPIIFEETIQFSLDDVAVPKAFVDIEDAKSEIEYLLIDAVSSDYYVLHKQEEVHNVLNDHLVQKQNVVDVEASLRSQFNAWYVDLDESEQTSEIDSMVNHAWDDKKRLLKEIPTDVKQIAKAYSIDFDTDLITQQGDYTLWETEWEANLEQEISLEEFHDTWKEDPYRAAWVLEEFSVLRKGESLKNLPRYIRWNKYDHLSLALGLNTQKFIEELLENDAPHSVVAHAWEELGKPTDWTDEDVKRDLRESIEWDQKHDVDWKEVLDKTQTELDEEERKRRYAPKQRTFASMYGQVTPGSRAGMIFLPDEDILEKEEREYPDEREPEAFATMDDFEHPYEVRERIGKAIGGFGKALGDLLSTKEKKLQRASLDAISQRFANLEISEDAEQLLLGLLDLQDDTSRRFALLELSDGVPVLIEGESKSDEHEATRMRGALLELEEAYMEASDYEKWKMQDNLVQNFTAIADEILRKEKAKWSLLGVGEPGEAGYYLMGNNENMESTWYGPFPESYTARRAARYHWGSEVSIDMVKHFLRSERRGEREHPSRIRMWEIDPTPLFLEAAANEAAAQVLEEEHPTSIRGKLLEMDD